MCQNCIVASVDCPSELTTPCQMSGNCQGILLSSVLASPQGCHEQCSDDARCQWYSYSKKESICLRLVKKLKIWIS